jgi:hypothetical protein
MNADDADQRTLPLINADDTDRKLKALNADDHPIKPTPGLPGAPIGREQRNGDKGGKIG